jgi:tetratricopeptide (TPR) repeat protein
MRTLLLTLILSLAARPLVAAPSLPDPAVVEEARVRFQRGVQLFHEGSFEAALAEFRRAYQIAPSYRILYNLAQVHFELHDYVGALRSFKQYLNDGLGEITPERRAQVEADMQKLEGRVAYLDISTNLAGADILVDDQPVGISPLDGPVLVNAGIRRVSAAKSGRTSPQRNVTMAGGDHVKIAVMIPDPPPTRGAAAAVSQSLPLAPAPVPTDHGRVWLGLGATAVLGAVAGGMALATRQAKKAFDSELNTFPSTKERLDATRSRMVVLAAVTDGLTAAALVAGGITLYFAVTGDDSSARGQARSTLALGVSPGGLTVRGRF